MKNIFNIYESIVDDDEKVIIDSKKRLITKEYVNQVMSECIPSIRGYVEITPEKNLTVPHYSYEAVRDGLKITKDLPDIIQFTSFTPNNDIIIRAAEGVTTLQGLPSDLSSFEVSINNCQSLKDFGDIKTVKVLYLKNLKNIKQFKRLPKAEKFIRVINCEGADEKLISKLSGVSKNKITVL